jgi:hypothetical protein
MEIKKSRVLDRKKRKKRISCFDEVSVGLGPSPGA